MIILDMTPMQNKIDTQGMSTDSSSPFSSPSTSPEEAGPRDDDSTRPVFSQLEREELKDIIIEALNEWSE
jgi:hypothetical protein